jgi:hypothetical protein
MTIIEEYVKARKDIFDHIGYPDGYYDLDINTDFWWYKYIDTIYYADTEEKLKRALIQDEIIESEEEVDIAEDYYEDEITGDGSVGELYSGYISSNNGRKYMAIYDNAKLLKV